MILYSPAKINLGLFVTSKRSDGFHNLQSVIVPVPFYDIIEIIPRNDNSSETEFSATGIPVQGPQETNLCMAAFNVFNRLKRTGPCRIHLHKQVPAGSGLGGGSSNAASVLMGLNRLTGERFTRSDLHPVAASIGSDCPFFLYDGIMYAEGRGERLTHVDVRLSGLHLVLISAGIHISTSEAYRAIRPDNSRPGLMTLAGGAAEGWKSVLTNDFEAAVFRKHPVLKAIKDELYSLGAVFASMSGSGSAVYGLFPENPGFNEICGLPVLWQGSL